MAICRFGIDIGLDKTIDQMKCDIQIIKFVLRKKTNSNLIVGYSELIYSVKEFNAEGPVLKFLITSS